MWSKPKYPPKAVISIKTKNDWPMHYKQINAIKDTLYRTMMMKLLIKIVMDKLKRI